MNWTNLLKSWCKGIVILGIIVFVIAGIGCFKEDQVILGLLLIIGGTLGSMLSVAAVMIFCEMAENMNFVARVAEQFSEMAEGHALGHTSTSSHSSNSDLSSNSNGWKCENCGAHNKSNAQHCSHCGEYK